MHWPTNLLHSLFSKRCVTSQKMARIVFTEVVSPKAIAGFKHTGRERNFYRLKEVFQFVDQR